MPLPRDLGISDRGSGKADLAVTRLLHSGSPWRKKQDEEERSVMPVVLI